MTTLADIRDLGRACRTHEERVRSATLDCEEIFEGSLPVDIRPAVEATMIDLDEVADLMRGLEMISRAHRERHLNDDDAGVPCSHLAYHCYQAARQAKAAARAARRAEEPWSLFMRECHAAATLP